MPLLRAFVDAELISTMHSLAPWVQIRAARGRDAETLVQICLGWQGAPAPRNPALLLELWNQTLTDDDSSVYLAYQKDPSGENVVGFVHVTYQARPARLGWRATLEELHVVEPSTLGSEPKTEPHLEPKTEQVARALLAAVISECRRRGDVIALYLLTQPDLEPHYSESMYAELGFVPRGRDVLIWQGQLLE
jgi:GNAT superfamily N-acetyltransferase